MLGRALVELLVVVCVHDGVEPVRLRLVEGPIHPAQEFRSGAVGRGELGMRRPADRDSHGAEPRLLDPAKILGLQGYSLCSFGGCLEGVAYVDACAQCPVVLKMWHAAAVPKVPR